MNEIRAYVGLDWGDRGHRVMLWDCSSEAEEASTIEQTPAALHAWADSLKRRFGGAPVAVAIEQSRGAVFDVLAQYKEFELYPINPRSSARYREAFRPSMAKDDPTDAAVLLDMLRKHRTQLRRFVDDDRQTRILRRLVEDRRSMIDERTRHILRLQAKLKEYFPQALEWAGGLETIQAYDFLDRWPSLAALQRARSADIRTFYRRRSHASERIVRIVEQIRAGVSLTEDEAIVFSAVLFVRSEVSQLRTLACSIAAYDQQIASIFASHADAFIFKSFPGAGAQLAPRLAAAFGSERDRYSAAVEVAERSGIAPVVKRSGKSLVVQMRWASPKFTRQTFHEFARLSIGHSAWAKRFYVQQRRRGVRPQAAFRALAYRWIRVMYACWRDRHEYNEQFYLQQLAQRGSPIGDVA